MPSIQEIIHKFEVGEGSGYLQKLALILSLLALLVFYNVREYQGFATVEAMESAHLARQLSEGKGFTSLSLRPLALAHEETQKGEGILSTSEDVLQHVDMVSPPAYPLFLSLWMRILPFEWEIPSHRSENFTRYQPEVLISFINQGLFLLNGLMVFYLGRKLFDDSVAWMSMACFFCADLLWRYSFSGHDTMLLTTWMLLLVIGLVALERASRAEEPDASEPEEALDSELETSPIDSPLKVQSSGWFLGVACSVGLLLGLAGLTRYSFLWMLVPTSLFALLCLGKRRWLVTPVMILTALLVVAPWLARNLEVSGLPFGLRSYALYMDTADYPEDRLERSLLGEVTAPGLNQYLRKTFEKLPDISSGELPTLGGSFLPFLFFMGLLIPFNNKGLRRLRWFTLGSLVLMVVIQSLGQTYLSEQSPRINGENHLVVLAPWVFLFAVPIFYSLLDQLPLPYEGLRPAVVLSFFAICSLPLWGHLLPPRPLPFAYPTYKPPLIQEIAQWNQPEEALMSDIPWAVAWYGNRPCYWLSRRVDPDFYGIHDERDAIEALYLTQMTTDLPFMSSFLQDPEGSWPRFYMDVQVRRNLPDGFPLKFGHPGIMLDQVYVSDRQRWLPAFKSKKDGLGE